MNGRLRRVALALVAIVAIAVPAVALSAHVKKLGYVTTELRVPTTNNEADAFARDFDGDGNRDNALGGFFATTAAFGVFDEQSFLDDAIAGGRILMLHSLRTPSFKKTKKAKWQVLYALPTDSPDFSGSGTYQVATAPRSATLKAKIKKGHVKTGIGTIPVRLDVGNGVFDLTLEDGRIFATCNKFSCSDGRITGAVTTQQINAILIPELLERINPIIARDCPGSTPESCMDSSQGKSFQQFFDLNDDMTVTDVELRQNEFDLFAPDLDLVKANGRPGQDGEPDALSLGLGFSTVKARLLQ
jgi:hypothetical protein